MDLKQKIGLGIMGPLFVIAVGHTVINKINENKENTTNTECIDDTLMNMSLSETAQFYAKQSKDVIRAIDEANEILRQAPQPDIPIDSLIRKICNPTKVKINE